MGAGAPKGNKNAEKWTLEKTTELFDSALNMCFQREPDGTYTYDFIGEIASELKTFHQNLTIHLPKRFPQFQESAKLLVSFMERNCYYNTKKGKIREAIGIVNLKSNHQWTDRQQVQVDGNVDIPPIKWVGHDNDPQEV